MENTEQLPCKICGKKHKYYPSSIASIPMSILMHVHLPGNERLPIGQTGYIDMTLEDPDQVLEACHRIHNEFTTWLEEIHEGKLLRTISRLTYHGVSTLQADVRQKYPDDTELLAAIAMLDPLTDDKTKTLIEALYATAYLSGEAKTQALDDTIRQYFA